jgi:hypothetical protein
VLGYEVCVAAQPIAGSFDLDDHGVMQEPVEERGCDVGIAEDLAPFGKPRLQVRIMAPFRNGR